MKSHVTALILGLIVLGASQPAAANAAPARIPTRMYPTGAHVTYLPSMSDETMDCMWGFFCEGSVPIFHFSTEKDLHRTGGWGQFAGWHNHAMTFELFVSHYDSGVNEPSTRWSAAAFADFAAALRANGYSPLLLSARIRPQVTTGGLLTEIQYNGPRDIVVMARWFGSTEIEALAMFSHRSHSARYTALADLAQQVHAAEGDA
jgi:hypothetical protein